MKKAFIGLTLTVIALNKVGHKLSEPSDRTFSASPYGPLKEKIAAMRARRSACASVMPTTTARTLRP